MNRPSANARTPAATVLNLKAGDWVEVRTREEILATLDAEGCLEKLPFMPEMLQYCGQRLRVYKRADKTCEYTQKWSIRRMKDAVHLESVRCDGSGHDGCQASCLVFWKEAWLKRAAAGDNFVPAASLTQTSGAEYHGCTTEQLRNATCRPSADGGIIYRCQATDVPRFTSFMSIWDPRQHIRDLRSGNIRSGLEGTARSHQLLEFALSVLRIMQATLIGLFNEVQERRRGSRYPFIEGMAEKGPMERLNLQPGELVEVRSREEIMATLDNGQKNRGLWFDSEMLPYCGGIYRVLRRVNHIVEEKTGRMVDMKSPCIVLEGVICRSDYHRLCPRAIYPYWRESWLKRAVVSEARQEMQDAVTTCKE